MRSVAAHNTKGTSPTGVPHGFESGEDANVTPVGILLVWQKQFGRIGTHDTVVRPHGVQRHLFFGDTGREQ